MDSRKELNSNWRRLEILGATFIELLHLSLIICVFRTNYLRQGKNLGLSPCLVREKCDYFFEQLLN